MKLYLAHLDCLARFVVYMALLFPLTPAHAASNSQAGAAAPELNQDPATPVEKKARNITEQVIASRSLVQYEMILKGGRVSNTR
ncbi:MAG: hypothetical protein O3C28_05720 [Proteobacteria bacterium]|nr:hypothetical protein [Pseudomonadota bacterium]